MNTFRNCVFGLFSVLLVSSPAFASELYLVTSEANSNLYTVETATGATTLIGATGVAFLSDVAIDGGGNMYATDGTRLYSVNTTTGAATIIGTSAFSNVFFVSGLDFDSAGTLWAVDTSVNTVVTINPADGVDTFQFATGWAFDSDIAHDSGDIFYSSGPFLGVRHLVELDVVAQSATDRGTIFSGTVPTAMDFDDSGTLFSFDGLTGDIYTIPNPGTSGAATFLVATSLTTISGATFIAPTAPVPSLSWFPALGLVLSLGLAGAIRARRQASQAGVSG